MPIVTIEEGKILGMAMAPAEGGKVLLNYGNSNQNSSASQESNETNVRGNRWVTYESAVVELTRKYLAFAQYGVGSAHAVISFMAAEIAGNGAILSSENPETKKFLECYTRWNKLDSTGFFNTARIGVIEGKVLREPQLKTDANEKEYDGKIVKTRTHRWTSTRYEPVQEDDEVVQVKLGEKKTLNKGEFVFIQIDGFLDDPINTRSPASKCIQNMEAIDHIASDLRLYNKKFPAATPIFEMEDIESAKWLHSKLFRRVGSDALGNERFVREWELGDSIILPNGKATLLEPAGNNVRSLVEELMVEFRIVSGVMGMPVIYLGPVDLPSNRATAQEAPEMLNAATITPREAYENGILEEVRIAARLLSEATLRNIPTDDITVKVPFVNMSWMELLAQFYSALGLADVISLETIREMIPTVDAKKEKARIAQQKQEALKNTMNSMRQNQNTNPDGSQQQDSSTPPPNPEGDSNSY